MKKWTENVFKSFGNVLFAECVLEVVTGSIQLLMIRMLSRAAGGLAEGEVQPGYMAGALAAVCGLAFFTPVLSYIRGRLCARSSIDLQTKLLIKAMRQRWSSVQSLGYQEYLNRLTGDVYEYRTHLFSLTAGMMAKLVLLSGAVLILCQSDQRLTAVCLMMAALPAVLPLITRRVLEKSSSRMKECSEKLFAFRNEVIERGDSVYVNDLMNDIREKEAELNREYMGKFREHQFKAQAVAQGSEFMNVFMWMVILLICAVKMHDLEKGVLFIGGFGIVREYLAEMVGVLQSIGIYQAVRKRLEEMTEDSEKETTEIGSHQGPLVWKKVNIAYGERIVLQDFSGEVRPGEKVALIGENGSGKSSFLRCLTGLLRPVGGEIMVCGNETTTLTTGQLRLLIAACLTDGVYLEGSFGRNILFTKDVDEERLKLLADTLDARQLLDRAGVLSGGEGKRIELIRTLAQDKPLYLFDEPEAMLDEAGKEGFIRLMRNLKGAVLIVTHDQEMASACDRVIRIGEN